MKKTFVLTIFIYLIKSRYTITAFLAQLDYQCQQRGEKVISSRRPIISILHKPQLQLYIPCHSSSSLSSGSYCCKENDEGKESLSPSAPIATKPKTTTAYTPPSINNDNEPLIRLSEIGGLFSMSRPNTIPMGIGLVALGARGARHTASSLSSGIGLPVIGRMILAALLTLITTSGSMLINDYYDHRDGIDTELTKPNRPLVTGSVRPSAVKFLLKWMYALHLTLLCLVDIAFVRLFVLASTLLTYLYSVHLKPITGLKNVVCATIVSMAVGLGAISWGSGLAGLLSVRKAMISVASVIWHREIIMDIKDRDGDKIVGTKTLPVVYGSKAAFRLSMIPLVTAVSAILITAESSISGRIVLKRPTTRVIIASAALCMQALTSLWANYRNFDAISLKIAIECAPVWILIALIALT